MRRVSRIGYLVLLIVFFAFFFRLWRGGELFFWHVDEDILALTIKRILIDHRPQLIGFPIPGGIYPGPILFYVISLPYYLVAMDPGKIPVFSAVFGAVSTFLVFKVASEIFENRRIGLFSAVIFGFSFLATLYSHLFTALTFAPILALFTYFILYKNLKLKKPIYLLWLGIILTLALQNEGSSISLIVLTFAIWLIFRFEFPVKKLKQVLPVVFISHISLFIFDLRHDFFLLKSALKFISLGPDRIGDLGIGNPVEGLSLFANAYSRLLFISGQNDISDQILPCFDLITSRLLAINPALFILSVVGFGYFLIHTFKKNSNMPIGGKIIGVHMTILLAGLFLYNLFMGKYLHEWVLVIFFPGFSMITAFILNKLYTSNILTKMLAFLFLTIFLFVNIKDTLTATNKYGLQARIGAVRLATTALGDKPFYFESLGSCYSQGYLYLFWYFGHLPQYTHNLILDPLLLGQRKDQVRPNLGVVFVNPSKKEGRDFFEKYLEYKKKSIQEFKSGEIEVLIVEEKGKLE